MRTLHFTQVDHPIPTVNDKIDLCTSLKKTRDKITKIFVIFGYIFLKLANMSN